MSYDKKDIAVFLTFKIYSDNFNVAYNRTFMEKIIIKKNQHLDIDIGISHLDIDIGISHISFILDEIS